MSNFYASPDLTAFVSTRAVDGWHVGVISVLQGTRSSRFEEECIALRTTPAEALRDARRNARAVVAAWRDKVKL
jgi:hypothetical protein